jgi:aerobic carbon-monoxide dehydrogenase medium subunit
MKAFAYYKPASLVEAVALLGAKPDGRPLAGGMTLLPTIKQRLLAPDALVDLADIANLGGITAAADSLTIGAMVRHVDVARSGAVAGAIPALARLAGGIGDPAVRNRGTIGGSLANNDPAADYPAGVLGLGATVLTTQREIAADQFFKGLFETALQPGEIITAVRFPKPDVAGYAKFASPASRYALVGVFVARLAGGVRVAVTGAGPGVFRAGAIEAALERRFDPAAIDGIAIDAAPLLSDIHADADYRAHLITVMARRAVASAQGPA